MNLGIHYYELEKIEKQEHGIVDKCLAAVIQRWMQEKDNVKKYGGATKQSLVSALRKMNETVLAEEVARAELGEQTYSFCVLL